jgi:ABC-type Co2+ transport system permease subunit
LAVVRVLCALFLRSFAACATTANSFFMLLLLGLVAFLGSSLHFPWKLPCGLCLASFFVLFSSFSPPAAHADLLLHLLDLPHDGRHIALL